MDPNNTSPTPSKDEQTTNAGNEPLSTATPNTDASAPSAPSLSSDIDATSGASVAGLGSDQDAGLGESSTTTTPADTSAPSASSEDPASSVAASDTGLGDTALDNQSTDSSVGGLGSDTSIGAGGDTPATPIDPSAPGGVDLTGAAAPASDTASPATDDTSPAAAPPVATSVASDLPASNADLGTNPESPVPPTTPVPTHGGDKKTMVILIVVAVVLIAAVGILYFM